MDFTREPIIESVITPKEGSTLAVRSSKGTGQEEYFVDAVELVSFGNALFFRSLERPKNFLLPVSDYEILEVRETRLVLKNVGLDRSIKIAGGREAALRTGRMPPQEKGEPSAVAESTGSAVVKAELPEVSEGKPDEKLDKKRDRRRNYKRRRGRDEPQDEVKPEEDLAAQSAASLTAGVSSEATAEAGVPPVVFSSLLPPPSTLISETIARYKDNVLFRGAFFSKEKEYFEGEEKSRDDSGNDVEKPNLVEPAETENIQLPTISLDLPEYSPPELSVEEEERIYHERQSLRLGRKKTKEENDEVEGYQQKIPFEETPEELSMPDEIMMQEEAEGFADNMDVDLRQKQKGQESQSDKDSSEVNRNSP